MSQHCHGSQIPVGTVRRSHFLGNLPDSVNMALEASGQCIYPPFQTVKQQRFHKMPRLPHDAELASSQQVHVQVLDLLS